MKLCTLKKYQKIIVPGKKSPAKDVSVIIYKLQFRVVKYTLYDIQCMFVFGALAQCFRLFFQWPLCFSLLFCKPCLLPDIHTVSFLLPLVSYIKL